MHGAKFAHKYIPFYQRLIPCRSAASNSALSQTFCGVTFKNPVGLAAGFDKNGSYIEALDGMGFGFIEVGTVTPKPQPGNPAPRLFRLPADGALINRMGFNNMGVNVLAARLSHLRKKRPDIVIGGNIGKNKLTPNEFAVNDYLQCINALYTLVDYFVVNVSSPNTPGLRELQDKAPLTEILNAVQSLKATLGAKQPVLLKIAPDLTEHQLNDIVAIVKETNIEGIIATNTTISRANLKTTNAELVQQAGGVSGRPLKQQSLHVVKYLRQQAGNQLFIIGVGGIENGTDALNMLNAGANLVQLYTGFIYKGPGLPGQICQAILKHKS